MSWRELVHLAYMLLRDPRSSFYAEAAGWSRPSSYEWMAVADLIDVTMQANSKNKPKPYKRPWDKARRVGGNNSVRRGMAEVRGILRPES